MMPSTKKATITLVAAVAIIVATFAAAAHAAVPAERLLRKRLAGRHVEHVQFFMHDWRDGERPSAVIVADSPIKNSTYGRTIVIDDKITTTPDPNAPAVGRGQGMYSIVAYDTFDLFLFFTAVFDSDNSTLSFQGADRTSVATRDLSIVGGTGRFALARGVASMNTVHQTAYIRAVLGFNCTITY